MPNWCSSAHARHRSKLCLPPSPTRRNASAGARHRKMPRSSTRKRISGRADVMSSDAEPKKNPQYRGITTYYDIVPNRRIVSSETVEAGGARLFVGLTTTIFEPKGKGTKVSVTTQVVSF